MVPRAPLKISRAAFLCSLGAAVRAQDVYVDSIVFGLPSPVKAGGLRVLYVFYPNGDLVILSCGLSVHPGARKLTALLVGAAVERGHWREALRGTVTLSVPCSRLPPPPGAAPCQPPVTQVFSRIGQALVPPVNPNVTLVVAPTLTNLPAIERFLLGRR
jgi:hypothetical protein